MMGKEGGNLGNDNFIAVTAGSCKFIKIIGAESCFSSSSLFSSLFRLTDYNETFTLVLIIKDKGLNNTVRWRETNFTNTPYSPQSSPVTKT